MSSNQLTNDTADLIAGLPENVRELTFPHMRARLELSRRILCTQEEALEGTRMVLTLVSQRGCGDTGLISDYLTDAEAAEMERLDRQQLDAERARAALDGWDRRSGYDALVGTESMPEQEMTITEDPDGQLVYLIPRPTEEDR